MKPRLKKLFFWSSLGSLAVGASVALAGKKPKQSSSPAPQAIPGDCQRVYVWTEPLDIQEEGSRVLSREHYVLQPTSFKVWSILELPISQGKSNPTGASVYHVSYTRLVELPGAGDPRVREKSRYYGTIWTVSGDGKTHGRDVLVRGATLEIRKCYVGGSTNGVETGEVHHSRAPILNYRFEYGIPRDATPPGRNATVRDLQRS